MEKISINKYPLFLIVNDEPSTMGGNHWTAICIKEKSGPIEFFCSYGLGVDNYNSFFKKFLLKFSTKIYENYKPLQSIGTNVCGYYAIYYLYKRFKGHSPKSIYCSFYKNKLKNDKIVKCLVKKLLFKNHNCKFIKQNYKINQCCNDFI